MFCVYKHTAPNGKVYIGITGRNPLVRWNFGNGYKNNPYFWNAIVKYGWDNIKHEILFDGLTKEEACQKEIELIAQYQSTNPDYGYNLSKGGQSGIVGYKFSDEQRKKVSVAHTGIKLSETARNNISNAKKGCKNPNWNKHPSLATIEKQRESSKKENLSAETRKRLSDGHKKAVICVELNMIFDSAKDAEEKLDILATSICKALKMVKGHKTAGGYHWEYVKEN